MFRHYKYILGPTFTAMLTIIASSSFAEPPAKPGPHTQEEIAAIERCVLTRMLLSLQSPVAGVSIDGHDPPAALLAPFANLVPYSRIDIHHRPWWDKTTHKHAVTIYLDGDKIQWRGADKASIDIGVGDNWKGGYFGTYIVIRRKGQWAISNYQSRGVV